MSPDSVRKLINAVPFAPLEFHLADGRTLEVPHPEFIAMSNAGRTLHVIDPHHDENWELADVFLVLSAGPKKKRPKSKSS